MTETPFAESAAIRSEIPALMSGELIEVAFNKDLKS